MEKVLIGMSGGVDSSTAAYLLKEQGYEVIGVNLRLWEGESGCAKNHQTDVVSVCEKIGIEYKILDYRKEFKQNVINPFISEYINGRTPNPCCQCNKHMKFKQLLETAKELGAKYIATGHYASIVKLDNGRYSIEMSESKEKDQSYALYGLSQEQLKCVLMPLSRYNKDEVREIARGAGLITAQKKDSQDICFVENGDYAEFIEKTLCKKFPAGDYVLEDGKKVGRHKGYIHYTIGQRKGLGIALGEPVFVNHIDVEKNQIVLGDESKILKDTLYADEINLMGIGKLDKPMEVMAKIRYAQTPSLATIEMTDDGKIKCVFAKEQRAITPGQAVVWYKENKIIGGGTIA